MSSLSLGNLISCRLRKPSEWVWQTFAPALWMRRSDSEKGVRRIVFVQQIAALLQYSSMKLVSFWRLILTEQLG